MITLKWAPIVGADVASYRVYKSMIGFMADLNPTAAGKTLLLKVKGGPLQTVTFTADLIASFNAAVSGASAYPSATTGKFLVRGDDRSVTGSVEIVGGTALIALGLSPRVITDKSHADLIATVEAPEDQKQVVSFIDQDGTSDDYYSLATVDSQGAVSDLAALTKPTSPSGPLCSIEGQVVNPAGMPVVDAKVRVRVINAPNKANAKAYVNQQVLQTLSDPSGNFRISVLQGCIARIEIPEIGYDQPVKIPEESFALLSELEVDTDYRFPTEFITG